MYQTASLSSFSALTCGLRRAVSPSSCGAAGWGGALGCQWVQGTEELWGSGGSGQFFVSLFFNAASWSTFVGKNSNRNATGFGKGFEGFADIQSLMLTGKYDFQGATPQEPWGAALAFPHTGSGCFFSAGLR